MQLQTEQEISPRPGVVLPRWLGGAVAQWGFSWWRCGDKLLLTFVATYLLLWTPLVARSTANPQLLATFVNDEPTITYQLVGMAMRPYGNPANLLKEPHRAPPEWHYLSYGNFVYYGGTYLDAAFLLYVPLHKWLGLPDFPVAPICLRCISLLSGLLALLLVYRLAQRLGGRWAAAGASLILLTDISFACYSSIIHPDATMLALSLATLWIAIHHAAAGRLGSLVGIGLLAGVVHGTKMGGPWLVPMALLATVWGLNRAGRLPRCAWPGWLRLPGRLVLLGAAAVVGFVVSTPYALLDTYYFDKAFRTVGLYTTSPWEQAHLGKWLMGCWDYLGTPLAVLHLLGFAAVAVHWFRGGRDRALTLTAVLGLSVIAWYITLVRLWVCVPYLLSALAVMGVLSAVLVARGMAALQRQGRWGHWAGIGLAAVAVAPVLFGQGLPVGTYLLREYQRDHFTGVLMGDWATAHLPRGSKILFDDCTYFDPTVFPDARLHGGLMTYQALKEQKPDFFIINESIYGATHYVQMRKTQNFRRGQEGPLSVLLYQDLLDRGGSPEADLVHVVDAPSPRPHHLMSLLHHAGGALGLTPFTFGGEIRLYRYRGLVSPKTSSSGRP